LRCLLKRPMPGWTGWNTRRWLDEFKVYGFRGGVENIVRNPGLRKKENGYGWLTREPVGRAVDRA